MWKKIVIAIILSLSIGIIVTIICFQNNSVEALSKYGSRGSEVTQIQTKLKRWGYYTGAIDGIYGTKTLEAVKYFQRKNGLTVDRNSRASNFKSNGNNQYEFWKYKHIKQFK